MTNTEKLNCLTDRPCTVCKYHKENGCSKWSCVFEQEPRKGHWIIDTHKIRAFGKKYETHDYSVHCDKCNYAWDYTTDKHGGLVSNFCPNCGADMREVQE